MPVTYVIKFQVVPERRNEFPELLQGVLDAMREESTLHEAILHRDPESKHRFTLYETRKSHEDAASSTPILVTLAGPKAFSTLPTISTSFPKAGMSMACPLRCHGFAITIATRMAT
jgi:Antibiotic biosynthesis monooxygenase